LLNLVFDPVQKESAARVNVAATGNDGFTQNFQEGAFGCIPT